MRKLLLRTAACIGLLGAFAACPASAEEFKLTSPDVAEGGSIAEAQVFNGFGCTGRNQSPALSWSGAPPGTRSFAITVYDPDAPTGSGWWHWLVVDLPASTTSLPAGAGDPSGKALPAGAIQIRTDFGKPGYGGSCPPKGDKPHRYIFTVFALKTDKLGVNADASGAMAGFMINANAIGKASLTATYGR
jgi:Raf kinase inhibitor-like YbhB/YbcL family protein